MPPGHFNALFVTDASLIAIDSAWDAIEAAVQAGSFHSVEPPGMESPGT